MITLYSSAPPHAYDGANGDLRLLASLYDVAFGIAVFDPAIRTPADLRGRTVHGPPRPSSVRLLTEALIFDGWGLRGEVELVDSRLPDLAPLIADGALAATSWNLLTLEGAAPMPLLTGGRFLPVDEAAFYAMNAAMAAPLGPCSAAGTVLIAFRQGIAVWDQTPGEICEGILDALTAGGEPFFSDVAEMARWPGLADEHRHPALIHRLARPGLLSASGSRAPSD